MSVKRGADLAAYDAKAPRQTRIRIVVAVVPGGIVPKRLIHQITV
jgi:hypothetical protein